VLPSVPLLPRSGMWIRTSDGTRDRTRVAPDPMGRFACPPPRRVLLGAASSRQWCVGNHSRVTRATGFTIRVHVENRAVTDPNAPSVVKRALLACVLALGLAAPATAAPGGKLPVDRGIVQSVSPAQLVLRSLDGSTLVFQLRSRTQILVNGAPATVS